MALDRGGARRGRSSARPAIPASSLARRLNNAEYNYTIRDLTGQDMQVTRQFPVDPANPAGFDNSGESLVMSPGAAEQISADRAPDAPITWC